MRRTHKDKYRLIYADPVSGHEFLYGRDGVPDEFEHRLVLR